MPENDVSLFVYTEGRRVICICGMDRQQAQTVLGVLEQDESRRKERGFQIAKCLDALKAKGAFIPSSQIGVNIKSQGGIVAESRPPIPGRVAKFLMRVCASRNSPGLDLLKANLRDFIAGQEPQVYRPFVSTEFARPIKLNGDTASGKRMQ